jgi:hypothetical protein
MISIQFMIKIDLSWVIDIHLIMRDNLIWLKNTVLFHKYPYRIVLFHSERHPTLKLWHSLFILSHGKIDLMFWGFSSLYKIYGELSNSLLMVIISLWAHYSSIYELHMVFIDPFHFTYMTIGWLRHNKMLSHLKNFTQK